LQPLQPRSRKFELTVSGLLVAQSLLGVPPRPFVQPARILESSFRLPKRFLQSLDDVISSRAGPLGRLNCALRLRERRLQWTHLHDRGGSPSEVAISKRFQ
jgi:hypothetical protein